MAKFCSSCGASLEDGAKFCDKCGASQSGETQNVGRQPTTIQISRKWRLLNFMFASEVYVDKVKIGKVSNGQTKIFEVAPGVHKLQLKMTYPLFSCFCRSHEFEFRIEDGKTLKFNSDYVAATRLPIIGDIISLFYGFKIIHIEQENH